MTRELTVTVVGAGALGAAMAARLGDTRHDVRLWNRSPERARAAADAATRVTAIESLPEALRGSSVVITVLRDGDAVMDVMTEVVGKLGRDAVWVQSSTVGPAATRALAQLAAEHGVAFLDAPVSGSTAPAREGRLVWLVAGDDSVLKQARPVLDALGSRVIHVGEDAGASALKLVVNAWMAASTVAMSDALALCDAMDVDHSILAEALEAGPLAMPYALQKMRLMEERAFEPGFAVNLALKDVTLAAASAPLSPLLEAVRDRLAQTVKSGHGDDDLAAVDVSRESAGGPTPPTVT
jgi:3-hydroxyisobutyrate dehydrogenase